MKKLFLAWQDPKDRHWIPVGLLTAENDEYRFVYTKGAKKSRSFRPFDRMQDFEIVYESKELFPFFANRLLSKSRPEYKDFLHWLNLKKDEDDPLALLARTEGIRATDNLTVFPCPEKQLNGTYHIHYFVHGIRYLPDTAVELVNNLQPKSRLYLMLDVQNEYDKFAIALRTDDPITIVGYCPRYIASDFHQLLKNQSSYAVKVIIERVNQDAPIQLRLLCSMTGKWPEGFRPCTDEPYEPLVEQSLFEYK